MSENEPVFYRMENYLSSYPNYSPDGDVWYTPRQQVRLMTFRVLKTTPCGAWVEITPDAKRFVRLGTRKQYAHETMEQARQAFIARKEAHVRHLRKEIDLIEGVLNMMRPTCEQAQTK